MFFSQDGVVNQGVVAQTRRFSFRDRARRRSRILASVRAVGSDESESWILALVRPVQLR